MSKIFYNCVTAVGYFLEKKNVAQKMLSDHEFAGGYIGQYVCKYSDSMSSITPKLTPTVCNINVHTH